MSNDKNYDDIVATIGGKVYSHFVSCEDLVDFSIVVAASNYSADAIACWFVLGYDHGDLDLTVEDIQILIDIGAIKSVETGEASMSQHDFVLYKQVVITTA